MLSCKNLDDPNSRFVVRIVDWGGKEFPVIVSGANGGVG
jgi:hypothetical protein